MTVILVTHEMGFAETVADRVVFVAEGSIIGQGPSRDLMRKPQHPRMRHLMQMVQHR